MNTRININLVGDDFLGHPAPIRLTIYSGPFSFQDYLTPDEADELADQLRAKATEVRTADALAEVDDGYGPIEIVP